MGVRWTMLAAAGPLAVGAWLTAAAPAVAEADYREGRKKDAVDMCFDRARELARDRDVGDLDLREVTRADEDNDEVRVEAVLRGRDDRDDRRRARMDCTVDFEGDNRITSFNEDDFIRDLRRDVSDRRDGNRDRDRNDGDQEAYGRNARQACTKAAQQEGYDIGELSDRERDGDRVEIDMRMRRNGNRWTATCAYDRRSNEARLHDVERRD